MHFHPSLLDKRIGKIGAFFLTIFWRTNMRYAQKDPGMGAYNISVRINNNPVQTQVVPELEDVIQVPLTTITFTCPNQTIPAIANAPDNKIYRVEVKEPAVAAPNSLEVVQYAVE
jgi:hypothetical protein